MTKTNFKNVVTNFCCLVISVFFGCNALFAQQTSQLSSLSDFRPNSGTWQNAGEVSADIDKPNLLNFTKGEGVIVNQPTKKNNGEDLISLEEFGDIDLEFEVMVAPQSNSGVYLMGQYEIQILDSWGKTTARAGDMGGVYERWDDSKPEGQKGYQGYAPRQNVSRAPGIWQNLKVSFQAPKFNEKGEKTENAKFLSVHLNGVMIHENLEVFGPTRGSLKPNDIPKGPIRIQGDHGAVAFRNIKVTKYETPEPLLSNLKYEVFKGVFNQEPDFAAHQAISAGQVKNIQDPVQTPSGENLIRYNGNITLAESGDYTIHMLVSSGTGSLKINNKKLTEMGEPYQRADVRLEKGTFPIEILVSKTNDWSDNGFDLFMSGPGLRGDVPLSENDTKPVFTVDPILVDQNEVPVLRSFIDLPDGKRITHAVSVASSQKVHYSFNLSTGNLVQVWRGGFLDATPMWDNRGNGVSKPIGAVVFLGNPEKNLHDTEFTAMSEKFKAKGYQLKNGGVEFHYENIGVDFKDFIIGRADGKGLDRTLSTEGITANKRYSIASGEEIKMIRDGLYWVVDKGYYIQMDPKSASKPTIESGADGKNLMVSISLPLQYSLLF
ncbi:protein of unknown function [Aquiflexum balticum DSM 16537]|uniref:3-keto-alpha-glucoside-1,2-lyase/3-keto-2-hydroxy-glucal hydratase domain-containing protein n=1 Tax=Aquiflexum balticum DSM 16537 TaxID=758820 RepID=A0A1W2HAN6_9BACT|nr:DUF1080 domain-containing protein [Aquiflexum balticum]SMD45965.1 protein of unknown function [Aquiflexum balticum DSM 16537]